MVNLPSALPLCGLHGLKWIEVGRRGSKRINALGLHFWGLEDIGTTLRLPMRFPPRTATDGTGISYDKFLSLDPGSDTNVSPELVFRFGGISNSWVKIDLLATEPCVGYIRESCIKAHKLLKFEVT